MFFFKYYLLIRTYLIIFIIVSFLSFLFVNILVIPDHNTRMSPYSYIFYDEYYTLFKHQRWFFFCNILRMKEYM